MHLDIALRARVHALETRIREHEVPVDELAPCIRSTMVGSIFLFVHSSQLVLQIGSLRPKQDLPVQVTLRTNRNQWFITRIDLRHVFPWSKDHVPNSIG